jgi:hypothetical protein
MKTVTFNIRKAEKEDFFDINTKPKYGTVYFLKSIITGEFDKQPYYLHVDTDKEEFKAWFRNGQIYVFTRIFDEVIIEDSIEKVNN